MLVWASTMCSALSSCGQALVPCNYLAAFGECSGFLPGIANCASSQRHVRLALLQKLSPLFVPFTACNAQLTHSTHWKEENKQTQQMIMGRMASFIHLGQLFEQLCLSPSCKQVYSLRKNCLSQEN